MPMILMPTDRAGYDGHLHYFKPLFIMAGLCLAFRFTVKGYEKSAANGKIIEGTVTAKGSNFIKYIYVDSSGKSCERKMDFTKKTEVNKYQLSQRIPLISTINPTYLSGKKTEYVAIKEQFDKSYDYSKKILRYCRWVTAISFVLVLLLSYYDKIQF